MHSIHLKFMHRIYQDLKREEEMEVMMKGREGAKRKTMKRTTKKTRASQRMAMRRLKMH